MDTVIVSVRENDLAEEIKEAFQDFWHTKRKIDVKNTLDKYSWTKGYRNQTKFKVDCYNVFIADDQYFDGLPPMRIGLHLSQFENFAIFQEWLQTILGVSTTRKLFNSPLYRLDLCVDLGVSYEDFEESLHQKRSTKVTTWKSSRRTLKIGTEAHQTYVYEKELSIDKLDYVPSTFEKTTKALPVRLESRFRKHKLPCSCLRELPALSYKNDLFSDLFLYGDLKEIAVKGLPLERRRHLYAFMYLREKIGFEKARCVFNKSRNYHRNIGKYLNTVQILDLNQAWKNRTRRYFNLPASSKSVPKRVNLSPVWRTT